MKPTEIEKLDNQLLETFDEETIATVRDAVSSKLVGELSTNPDAELTPDKYRKELSYKLRKKLLEKLDNEVSEVFPKRLFECRRYKGMSQLDLTLASGIAQSQLSRYEGGHNIPTPHLAFILAQVLDTTVDYLYGGDLLREKYFQSGQ